MDPSILTGSPLFAGCREAEIKEMLTCLNAQKKTYPKDTVILHSGDMVRCIGLVCSGSVHIENDDLWGNKSILDCILPGQVFAETYACAGNEPLMVSAVAATTCEILFLNVGQMLHTCPNTCGCHARLIENLLAISARKNLTLSRRMFHTSAKSIRGRLSSYLSWQAQQSGSCEFDIPFNRQQLADYLGVDRSALSAEIGKMQREGLFAASRSHFRLFQSLL